MKTYRILAVNPGSTSTKIGFYENENLVFETTIRHSSEELSPYEKVADQFKFRKDLILGLLKKEDVDIHSIDAVVGRGGLLHPIASGVYEINDKIVDDLTEARYGEHASNLGALIAKDLAEEIGGNARAFITDPVVVDEMEDVARVAGHPLFKRVSIFHALNQKMVARSYADSISKKYEDLNLVIAHLGGGVSVAAHKNGRVVDVNNALDGDGPFSPERSGGLPAGQLADICFSSEYTHEEVRKMLVGKGGIVAHLGTNNMIEVREKAAAGDKHFKLILDAMIYNIGKEIGAMSAALSGKVDAIIITGGMAHSETITGGIKNMVGFIAPVIIHPGEDELGALAANGLRVLKGEVNPSVY